MYIKYTPSTHKIRTKRMGKLSASVARLSASISKLPFVKKLERVNIGGKPQ